MPERRRPSPEGDPPIERSKDWIEQARRDLENAEYEAAGGYYEWAAFAAQEAAEEALKAAYQHVGRVAWGRSSALLLEGLFAERGGHDEALLDHARLLDRFYIPARYPNDWAQGIPGK